MKFIKVDHTPLGKPMSDDEVIYDNIYVRYVRIDQFVEFRLIDNYMIGSDRVFLICGVLPNEERISPFDNVIASFDNNGYNKAKCYLDNLLAEIKKDGVQS